MKLCSACKYNYKPGAGNTYIRRVSYAWQIGYHFTTNSLMTFNVRLFTIYMCI